MEKMFRRLAANSLAFLLAILAAFVIVRRFQLIGWHSLTSVLPFDTSTVTLNDHYESVDSHMAKTLPEMNRTSRPEVDETVGQLFVPRVQLKDDPEGANAVCRNYDWKVYDERMILKHSPKIKPLKCDNSKANASWIQVDEDYLRIRSWEQETGCNFTELVLVDDHTYIRAESTWSRDNYLLIHSDTAEASCQNSKYPKRKFSGVYLGAHKDVRVEADSGTEYLNHPGAIPVNIFVWMFRSTSRNAFIRQMPLSWEFIKENLTGASTGLVFNGYNAVDYGTKDSLIAMLTGQRIKNWRESSGIHEAQRFIDEVVPEFLWDVFRRNGYVTAYFEDMGQNGGLFHSRTSGFRDPPVDHYVRPFMLARQERGCQKGCHYATTLNKVSRKWFETLWTEYREKPKFFLGVEPSLPAGSQADENFVEFLKWYTKPGVSNDTVLVIASDHGQIDRNIALSIQGRTEARTPLLLMNFPHDFTQNFPELWNNLVINSNRLTTPMDLHATLNHFLQWDLHELGLHFQNSSHQTGHNEEKPLGYFSNYEKPVAMSLFKAMPPSRTCLDADISPHWCACATWVELKHNLFIIQFAEAAVQFINDFVQDELMSIIHRRRSKSQARNMAPLEVTSNVTTANHTNPDLSEDEELLLETCNKFTLVKVKRATELRGKAVRSFEKDLTNVLSGKQHEIVSNPMGHYSVILKAKPGPSYFDVTGAFNGEEAAFAIQSITRLGRAGDTKTPEPAAKCLSGLGAIPNLHDLCHCRE